MKFLSFLLFIGFLLFNWQSASAQTAVCQNQTTYLNAAGFVWITANSIDGGSTSFDSLKISGREYGLADSIPRICIHEGTTTVTLSAFSGVIASTCIATITTLDTFTSPRCPAIPINRNDSLGLHKLKYWGFLPGTLAILPTYTPAQWYAFNDRGIGMDTLSGGSEYRVKGITLEAQRAVNGFTIAISMDTVATFFTDGKLIHVQDLYIGSNNIVGNMQNFPRLDSLIDFRMNGNRITDISGTWFPTELKSVTFSGNLLTNIPQALFTDCPNIIDINLSNNLIANLPAPDVTNQSINLGGSGTILADMSYYSGLDSLKYLKLNNNNLSGVFPLPHFFAAQLLMLPADRPFQELNIANNNYNNISKSIANQSLNLYIEAVLAFPNLLGTNSNISVQGNALDFEDLNALMISIGYTNSTEPSFLTYTPQDSIIGTGGVRRRGLNMPLNFQLETEDPLFSNRNVSADSIYLSYMGYQRNEYEWYWGNTTNTALVIGSYDNTGNIIIPSGTPLAIAGQYWEIRDAATAVQRPTLAMISDSFLHESFVFSEIVNPRFPALTLFSSPKTIIVGNCLDNLGQVIQCQELSVQFDDTTSAAVRELRRAEFGATVIESCVCGKIELWALPDTFQRVSMEANGAGTRLAAGNASAKPGLKSADPNYPLLWTNGGIVDTTPTMANVQGNRNTGRTLIAVIDSGSDPDHPLLSANLRANANETPNDGSDDDGNCITDDVFGYNFLDRNNIAYDDHGHGTRVAGILAGYGSPSLEAADTSIAILPIKYTNILSQGTSYEAACAIYYAADYHVNNSNGNRNADSVRVINASWGYQGEYCQILHDAIDYAGKNCGVLFVCSAGNESADNNQVAHYPSNFELDNILAVASSEANGNSLSTYSNYGATTVDIAAPGTYTNTLIPQVGISPNASAVATSGTSFAAPYVSRAAGILFNRYPDASYESVKRALMMTATPINGADSAKIYSRGIVNLPAALAYLDTMTVRNVCSHVVAVGTDITYLGEQAKVQTVFPNPVSNAVQIIFAVVPENDVQIQVLDLKGTVILQQTMQGQALLEVSMQNVPQGFYILQVRDGSTLTAHKIIKM
jgi:hypothetical protein